MASGMSRGNKVPTIYTFDLYILSISVFLLIPSPFAYVHILANIVVLYIHTFKATLRQTAFCR
jgi:hypothetical protein